MKPVGPWSRSYQVSRRAAPPAAGTAKTLSGPKRSEAKAIVAPSGDQTGWPA